MGRSASCFKIISCGGDSVGQDELDLAEVPDLSFRF